MTYTPVRVGPTGLRLHFNENTAGCSPAVLAAVRALTAADFAYYPDYDAVTEACERWFEVPSGWVQLTNGLDEGLHVVAQLAARARDSRVIIVEPAFEMYAASAEAVGLATTPILSGEDFEFPLDEVLQALSPTTSLIYLTDPNNPTGLAIPAGAIERIASAAPHAIVLVDEAYAEFSGRTLIGPALDRHRNIVVGRTFAKAHGLAALRAGALVAHSDTMARLRALLPPYSLNICAVRALEAALQSRDYVDWYVSQSVDSRRLIYDYCEGRGLEYWPSEANFVLVRIGASAANVVAALAERGIFVRDKSRAPRCQGCVRITAGIVDHTRACLEALRDVLA